MIFFVNEYLLAMNSGIEHTQLKRLRLFKEKKQPAKIVTRDFDPLLEHNIQRLGFESEDVINLYNYFRNFKRPENGPKFIKYMDKKIVDLQLPDTYEIKYDSQFWKVFNHGNLIACIYFIDNQLYYIVYFDSFGKVVKKIDYDLEGYKVREQNYDALGNINVEFYFYKNGDKMLEENHFYNDRSENYAIQCQLFGYKNKSYLFNSIDNFMSFFLDQLNEDYEGKNIFIADRPVVTDKVIALMQTKAKKILAIPTQHALDPTDQRFSNLNNIYYYGLHQYVNKFSAILTDTENQKQDLQEWFGNKITVPIYSISAAISFRKKANVNFNNKISIKNIVYSGHLESDKQLDNMLEAFANLYKLQPVTLTIYGYGSQKKNLENKAVELGLSKSITFKGYTLNKDEIYKDKDLFWYTSISDAQPLSILEALERGIPVIAYDSLYGPNEMIQNGVNGYLVKLNNQDELVSVTNSLFNDEKKLLSLKNNCFSTIEKFSSNSIWSKWQKLINDLLKEDDSNANN